MPACETFPAWDVNDALEDDVRQLSVDSRTTRYPPDDYLKNLTGSLSSPELGRSLSLNVYAEKVRRYKKRNLQQAASVDFERSHAAIRISS